jgi:hypothetical protein
MSAIQHHVPARPKGISLLAGLAFVGGLVHLTKLIIACIMLSPLSTNVVVPITWQGWIPSSGLLLLAYGALWYGLWYLKKWGRNLATAWYLLVSANDLLHLRTWKDGLDVATLLGGLVAAAIVVYLLTPTVAVAFHRATTEPQDK